MSATYRRGETWKGAVPCPYKELLWFYWSLRRKMNSTVEKWAAYPPPSPFGGWNHFTSLHLTLSFRNSLDWFCVNCWKDQALRLVHSREGEGKGSNKSLWRGIRSKLQHQAWTLRLVWSDTYPRSKQKWWHWFNKWAALILSFSVEFAKRWKNSNTLSFFGTSICPLMPDCIDTILCLWCDKTSSFCADNL